MVYTNRSTAVIKIKPTMQIIGVIMAETITNKLRQLAVYKENYTFNLSIDLMILWYAAGAVFSPNGMTVLSV